MKFLPAFIIFLIALASATIPALAAESDGPVVVPSAFVAGAGVIKKPGRIPLQTTATRIAPNPKSADQDKARTAFDGCMAYGEEVTLPPCVYGRKHSHKSVVLLGDSRAMQYFPAIAPIAHERKWRLTALFKADCAMSLVDYEGYCDKWKRNMLDRIRSMKDPDLIIIASATKNLYRATVDGVPLSRQDSEPYLADGMARLIRKLKRVGDRVIVIRDQSPAPFSPPACVIDHTDHLRKCAFKPRHRAPKAFERSAARRTNTEIIDPTPMFCSRHVCPSVIGDAVVYKDSYHLTATYSRTLSDWMARRLPDFRR